jgi:hypothetical protein
LTNLANWKSGRKNSQISESEKRKSGKKTQRLKNFKNLKTVNRARKLVGGEIEDQILNKTHRK